MTIRSTYQVAHWYEHHVTYAHMNVAIGASGAPTLTANYNKGIASITRNSTGKYTIVMGDPAQSGSLYLAKRLLQVTGQVMYSSISGVISVQLVSDSLSSAGSFVIQCVSATGVAADPESGSTLLLEIALRKL